MQLKFSRVINTNLIVWLNKSHKVSTQLYNAIAYGVMDYYTFKTLRQHSADILYSIRYNFMRG